MEASAYTPAAVRLTEPIDQFLAEYTPDPEHIPDIRRALTRAGIPLDCHQLGELIYCYEHTIGPQQPFGGFGETFAAHAKAATSLHAIMMMTKSHHDEPWGE